MRSAVILPEGLWIRSTVPERTHSSQLLNSERVGGHDQKLIPLDRAHERERGPRAPAAGLHDRHAGFQGAAPLGLFDHGLGHAVLVGARRVEGLELHEYPGVAFRHGVAEADDRRVADGV